ncbi:MAG: Na+/H+ antiporter NhaC family protein [Pseudomonadales bacterium]
MAGARVRDVDRRANGPYSAPSVPGGEQVQDWGLWSLMPLVVTLVLAFTTRSALLAMLLGAFVGTLMLGAAPGVGLNELFQSALGNADFIWICQIVILIGVLFELFKRAGVLGALAARFAGAAHDRRRVELTTWTMGLVIVDDYFSPLMTGAVMRPLADRAGVPREKLAFILDATTASVCILVPFTAWGAYVASLIAAQGGDSVSAAEGLAVFIAAIPFNFYPLLMLAFALLLCLGWLPDFGPMRRAERRVRETGALLRPGAVPLADGGEDDWQRPEVAASLLLELALPVAVVVGVAAYSLIQLGSVKIVEAFLAGVVLLCGILALRGKLGGVHGLVDTLTRGAQGVMPALLIVALAYALNAVAGQLGVGEALIAFFAGDIDARWLVTLTFLLSAAIAFATGTSWGAFAMMMPLALPVAVDTAGAMTTPLVYQTVAAVAGGGIFGDHASPVSDTTVLASVGAGSDHMDHVITQLPYALACAALTAALYLMI